MATREYIDKDRDKIRITYYDLMENIEVLERKDLEDKLRELINLDADFLDPYLILYEMYLEEDKKKKADEILDDAYSRAIKLITDKNGKWPDILDWSWSENRHIIRTILNKAMSLWDNGDTEEALNLLRKLLKTNPYD
ncbi:MAG: tetratricopeptide repeat protein, partial [Thermoplasmata archaeon]